MKTTISIVASLTSILLGVQGQVAQPPAAGAAALVSVPQSGVAAAYTVVERGPHYRVWAQVLMATNQLGQVLAATNRAYVQLASGMSYLEGGQWVDAREEFELNAAGYAVASHGQYQVTISPVLNDAQGTVQLVTPEGYRMRSTLLGLTLHDRRSGQSVVVGEVATNAAGQQIAPNEILFSNCFSGFAASVRYVYQKGVFHQDVVLAENLDASLLTAAGYSPATSELQVWTEFFEAPQPVVSTRVLEQEADPVLRAQMAEPTVVEQDLSFGSMKMPMGKVYMLGGTSGEQSLYVPKRWVTTGGRTLLVESVPLKLLGPLLAQLPSWQASPLAATRPQFNARRQIPTPTLTRKTTQSFLAWNNNMPAPAALQGLVLDYQLGGTVTDFTFQSDTTYWVTNYFSINGVATFEGGTVVKFPENGSGIVFLYGGVNCQTGPYRLAICTSVNDNSVGTALGSGTPATSTDAFFWNYSGSVAFHYMRIAYAGYALVQDCDVWDSQFVNCGHGLSLWNGANLHNVLFAQCPQAICPAWGVDPLTVTGEHLTVDQCDYFMAPPSYGVHTADLTNCIFTALTNALPAPANTAPTVVVASSGAGIYQTVGAGSYYLAQDSPYRNAGTWNIATNVLAEIGKKTTYPPLVLSNVTVSVNTSLTPQAQRDSDTPDLGYHYDPIDYITSFLTITNATLTVTNGTAVGCYNDSAGIWLQDNSAIISIGSPLAPNWFVRYQSVQEQSLSLGSVAPSSAMNVNACHYGNVGANAVFRFSEFACPANGGYHIYHYSSWSYGDLLLQDCALWSGSCYFGGAPNTVATLRNNLLSRPYFSAYGAAYVSHLSMTNNLVWGASYLFLNQGVNSGNVWYAFNNAFDSCTNTLSSRLTNGYNAYINGSGRLQPTNVNDVVLSSFTYTNGPLGSFYQFSTNLVDKGSTNANLVGLYHYTTQASQLQETNSIVDIGFHYVAVDANGNPIDTGGDGTPDYLNDANGNGLVDSGETDWRSATDWGLKVLITRPQNNSIIP